MQNRRSHGTNLQCFHLASHPCLVMLAADPSGKELPTNTECLRYQNNEIRKRLLEPAFNKMMTYFLNY